MIAEFTLENYRSFKEKHTFSLISTKSKELSYTNSFEGTNKLQILKSAVLYGANASGKSNFFNALSFFLNFAVYSGPRKQVGDLTGTSAFAFSKQSERQPSFFEVVFYIGGKDGKKIRYRYGLSLNEKKVFQEYLFAIFNVREVALFTRDGQNIAITSYFKEGSRGKEATRDNCSMLSICAQNNGEISAQIINYFKNLHIISGLADYRYNSMKQLKNNEFRQRIINFLHYADIQIKGLRSELIPMDILDDGEPEAKAFIAYLKKKNLNMTEPERLFFGHDFYDGEKKTGEKYLDEADESSGTLKLFSYAYPILNSLENGTPLFIDEFDNMLHPLIIEAIIKLFNSETTNPRNAQLVVSCHAINILSNKLLRRDQIWFCEKDMYGATDLYSLVEYIEPSDVQHAVRNDASFSKNYLQGKYGAVPYIDDILLQAGLKK
jgi:AAA15 family ATPase/GTPase